MSSHAAIVSSYVIPEIVSEVNLRTLVWPVLLLQIYCCVLKGCISCKPECFWLYQVWAVCKLAIKSSLLTPTYSLSHSVNNPYCLFWEAFLYVGICVVLSYYDIEGTMYS
jgi:hypothetical protein